MSETEILQELAKTTARVLQSGDRGSVSVDASRPIFERINDSISPVKRKLNVFKDLATSGSHLLEGNYAKAGEGLTLTAVKEASSSDTVLNRAKEIGFVQKAQEAMSNAGDKISKIPYIGKFLANHGGKAVAIIPAGVALVASPSVEASGKFMVTACGIGGGVAGGVAGTAIPVAGTALGAHAGSEAATEFCAQKIGDILHVKLNGSNTLSEINDFVNLAKTETGKFEVSNVKNWEGIPSLQIPHVKQQLGGKANLPTT